MKKILIFIGLLSISNILKANDSCNVWFENLDTEPYFAKIYKDNENYFQSSVYKDYIECKVDKKNKLSFFIKQHELITISINDFCYFIIAVVPGDKITISIYKNLQEAYPKFYINFFGSNAKAHTKYYNEYYPIAKKFNGIDKAEHSNNSYKGYYIDTRAYIDSLVDNFRSECTEENNSNKDVVQLYTLDFKAALYNYAKKRLGNVKIKDTLDKWNKYFQWRNFRELFYFHGEAYNKELIRCFTGRFLYNDFLTDIIKSDSLITDTLLKKNDLSYFILYPNEVREEAWGEELLDLMKFFPSKNFVDYINLFSKNYPKSQYLARMSNFRDSVLKSREIIEGNITVAAATQDLKQFFTNTNSRYYFIDCWATWCVPCIQEFNYYTNINSYLLEKKIQPVYFSVDKITDSAKVYKYIKEQNIKGIHTIVNQSLVKEIIIELKKDRTNSLYDTDETFAIPRYLLYDKKKNKLYINLPKPSSGNVLKEAIKNIIEQ